VILQTLVQEYPIAKQMNPIETITNSAIAVMCLFNHQSVDVCLKHIALAFEPLGEKEQVSQDEIDDLLGEICCMTGKSFANVPNYLLAEEVNVYIQAIDSNTVKVQNKKSVVKRLQKVLVICAANEYSMDTDALSLAERDFKGWQYVPLISFSRMHYSIVTFAQVYEQ
jgi:hypothetical protein